MENDRPPSFQGAPPTEAVGQLNIHIKNGKNVSRK